MSDRLVEEVIAQAKQKRAAEEAIAIGVAVESIAAAAWPSLPEVRVQERAQRVDEVLTKYYNRRTKGWRSKFMAGILKVESYQIPVRETGLKDDYVILGDGKNARYHEHGLRTRPFNTKPQPTSEEGFQVELGWEVGVAKRVTNKRVDGPGSTIPSPSGVLRIWEVAHELQTGTHLRVPAFDISHYGLVHQYSDGKREAPAVDLEGPAGNRVMELLELGIDFVQK